MFHDVFCMLSNYWRMQWGPENVPNSLEWQGALLSGTPRKTIENHDVSSLRPGHQKSARLFPKPLKTMWKWHQNRQNPNICEKLFFAIPPIPNAWFWSPRQPDSDPRIFQKRHLRTCTPKNLIVVPKLAKTFNWQPRNPPKIDRNPSLEPQGLLPCTPKSPSIARWSPRCQIGCNKHAK